MIVERTSAGRIAAKARGVRFGPRPTLGAEQISHARQLIKGDGKPVAEVARLLGVHRATLYRALDDNSVAEEMRSSLQKSRFSKTMPGVSWPPAAGLDFPRKPIQNG